MTRSLQFPPDIVAIARAAIEAADAKAEVIGEPVDAVECIANAILADRAARIQFAGLTPVQAKCLQFIADYQAGHGGIAPSYDEIAAHMGVLSKSAVTRLIDQLEARGRIARVPNRSRAITILPFPPVGA